VQDYPLEGEEKHAGQLAFFCGDVLRVLEQDDESGWWAGHKEGETQTGWFPATAVQVFLSTKLPESEVPCGKLQRRTSGDHEAPAAGQNGPLSRFGRKVATPFGGGGAGAGGSRVTPRPITQGMQDRRTSGGGGGSRPASWVPPEVRSREQWGTSSETSNVGFGGRTRTSKPTGGIGGNRQSLDGQKATGAQSPGRATPGIVEPIATSRRGSPGPTPGFNILAVRRAERKLNAGGSHTPQATPKVIRSGPRGSLLSANPSPSPSPSSSLANRRGGGVGGGGGYRTQSSPSPGPSARNLLARRTAVSSQSVAVQEKQAMVEAKTTAWIEAMRSVDELSAKLAADGHGGLTEGGLADHEKIARLVTKLESDRARLESYAMEVRNLQDQLCQRESDRARANSFSDEVKKLNERLCQHEAERARVHCFEEEVRSLQERLCQQEILMSALESARELLVSVSGGAEDVSVRNLKAHETVNHMISRLRVEMDRNARLSEEVQNLRHRVAHLEEMALNADLEGSLSMSNEPSSILAVGALPGSETPAKPEMVEVDVHAVFSGVFSESLERAAAAAAAGSVAFPAAAGGRRGDAGSPRRVRSVREIVAHFERGQRPLGAPAWVG